MSVKVMELPIPSQHWIPISNLTVEDVEADLRRLQATSLNQETPVTIDDVAGCLKYSGPAKTLQEMEEAIAKGVRHTYSRD